MNLIRLLIFLMFCVSCKTIQETDMHPAYYFTLEKIKKDFKFQLKDDFAEATAVYSKPDKRFYPKRSKVRQDYIYQMGPKYTLVLNKSNKGKINRVSISHRDLGYTLQNYLEIMIKIYGEPDFGFYDYINSSHLTNYFWLGKSIILEKSTYYKTITVKFMDDVEFYDYYFSKIYKNYRKCLLPVDLQISELEIIKKHKSKQSINVFSLSGFFKKYNFSLHDNIENVHNSFQKEGKKSSLNNKSLVLDVKQGRLYSVQKQWDKDPRIRSIRQEVTNDLSEILSFYGNPELAFKVGPQNQFYYYFWRTEFGGVSLEVIGERKRFYFYDKSYYLFELKKWVKNKDKEHIKF